MYIGGASEGVGKGGIYALVLQDRAHGSGSPLVHSAWPGVFCPCAVFLDTERHRLKDDT